jgi:amylosucrase
MAITSLPNNTADQTHEQRGVSTPTLTLRLEKHAVKLRALLIQLYGEKPDFEPWFNALVSAINNHGAKRSKALQALDAQRIAAPDWFTTEHMLAYTTYVDRFATNLSGVQSRIAHLQELGVTYLHLLPFMKWRAGANDGGFAVSSFDEVEPSLGTHADLERLCASLREAGISLCADIVLNHVADDHPWAVKAKAGDAKYRDYFVVVADEKRVRFEKHLGQVFPATAPGNFTAIDAMQGFVWTTFYPYQWDLNYANPAVFAEMAIALLTQANSGVEVFRLDSVAFLWKREGTSCTNLPEAHLIVQALRCIVDIAAPGVLLKAEAIMPTRELPPYLGVHETSTQECHLAYHSSLMSAMWLSLAEENAQVLKQVIRNTPLLPENTSWLTYVRCHDDIGWNVLRPELTELGDAHMKRAKFAADFFSGATLQSYAKGASFQAANADTVHGTNGMASELCGLYNNPSDSILVESEAERRLLLLYKLSWCFGGLPLIYMGDELGLSNSSSTEGMTAAEDGRRLHRPKLSKQAFARRTQAGTLEHRLFTRFCKLANLRRSLPELNAGVSRQLIETNDDHATLVLKRSDSFLFIANMKSISMKSTSVMLNMQEQAATAAGHAWHCAETGERITLQQDLPLKPWQSYWLVLRPASP